MQNCAKQEAIKEAVSLVTSNTNEINQKDVQVRSVGTLKCQILLARRDWQCLLTA